MEIKRKVIIFQRDNYVLNKNISNNIKLINVNNNTSSSLVRQKIKTKANYREFLSDEVIEYIDQEGLYK